MCIRPFLFCGPGKSARLRRRPLQRLCFCVAKGLENVFALQVGIVLKKFFNGSACADLPYYITNGDTHTADACFATHDARNLSNAVKLIHFLLPYWKLILARGRRDS